MDQPRKRTEPQSRRRTRRRERAAFLRGVGSVVRIVVARADAARAIPARFGLSMSSQNEISQLLVEYGDGKREALDRLMPILYAELRKIAVGYLKRERDGHTLQPTALVNEAFVRLVDQRVRWRNRAHFLGVAAQLMRRILVDYARGRAAEKRGAGFALVALDEAVLAPYEQGVDLVSLDDALQALSTFDPLQGRIVELRFFGGCSIEETAEALGISTATVTREWAVARAWLRREIARGGVA
jgi:RNA polymerase sigma-70 factor, ECF subfamily